MNGVLQRPAHGAFCAFWHPPALSPEALKDYDSDYWSTFLDVPPVAFIECIR
jgi:hypothetical protein